MADQKITELVELTTPAGEDLLGVVDDPSGTPATKKITLLTLLENLLTTTKARAYLGSDQLNLTDNTLLKVQFDTETYDAGNDFDISVLVSGTADGNTLNHLIDSGADFVNDGVKVGDRVKNTDDTLYAYVTAVAAQDLTLNTDAFPDGNEAYEIKKARFTAPVAGYYLVVGAVAFKTPVADKGHEVFIKLNGASYPIHHRGAHASNAAEMNVFVYDIMYLGATNYIELWVRCNVGASTVDIRGSSASTYLAVHLLSI